MLILSAIISSLFAEYWNQWLCFALIIYKMITKHQLSIDYTIWYLCEIEILQWFVQPVLLCVAINTVRLPASQISHRVGSA